MKLHRHKTLLTALLLVAITCAATARIAFFCEANSASTIWLHKWQDTDMGYFHSWARLIADGDYLSADLQPPLHDWQVRLAQFYSQRTTEDQISRSEAADAWRKWMQPGSFYQDPLYAYSLASTYKFVSNDHRVFIVLQQFLGIATLLLLYLITKKSLGRTTAVLTLCIAAAYPMALFYEMFLLRESFILFLCMLLIFSVQVLTRRPHSLHFVVFGLTSGLAILLKSSLALLVLLLILGHFLTADTKLRAIEKLRPLGFLLAGLLLILAPLIYRNWACELPLFSLPSEGAIVFALHNVNGYPPMGGDNFSDGLLQTVAGIAQRTNFELLPTIMESVKTHDSVGAYLVFVSKKFLYLWGWFEIPSNENYYFEKMQAPVLRILPIGFVFLMSLGLTGIVLSINRWRRCWPLYAMIVTNICFLTLFLNLSRLRLPLAVALMPFAAVALVNVWQLARRQRYRRLAGITAAVIVLAAISCNWPPRHDSHIRLVDYRIPFMIFYWPAIETFENSGNHQAAASLCSQGLKTAPDDQIDRLLANPTPVTLENYDLLLHFYETYIRCADVYARSGMEEASWKSRATARRMEATLDQQTLFLDQQN